MLVKSVRKSTDREKLDQQNSIILRNEMSQRRLNIKLLVWSLMTSSLVPGSIERIHLVSNAGLPLHVRWAGEIRWISEEFIGLKSFQARRHLFTGAQRWLYMQGVSVSWMYWLLNEDVISTKRANIAQSLLTYKAKRAKMKSEKIESETCVRFQQENFAWARLALEVVGER